MENCASSSQVLNSTSTLDSSSITFVLAFFLSPPHRPSYGDHIAIKIYLICPDGQSINHVRTNEAESTRTGNVETGYQQLSWHVTTILIYESIYSDTCGEATLSRTSIPRSYSQCTSRRSSTRATTRADSQRWCASTKPRCKDP